MKMIALALAFAAVVVLAGIAFGAVPDRVSADPPKCRCCPCEPCKGKCADCQCAKPKSDLDLSGIYKCSGHAGGKAYTGAVVIRRVNGQIYVVEYSTGSAVKGVGLHLDGTLSVSWSPGHDQIGNTQYKVVYGRKLIGRWVVMAGPGVGIGAEILERVSDLPAVPKTESPAGTDSE